MSTVLRRPGLVRTGNRGSADVMHAERADPAYGAYVLLRVLYVLLPLVMGIDKYFNALAPWPRYLADWIDNIVPGTAQQFMYVVGAVEIVAALVVLVRPRWGAYLVAAWLAGIVINLVTYGEWYDIAVRDGALMVGALALGRLAGVYDRRTSAVT